MLLQRTSGVELYTYITHYVLHIIHCISYRCNALSGNLFYRYHTLYTLYITVAVGGTSLDKGKAVYYTLYITGGPPVVVHLQIKARLYTIYCILLVVHLQIKAGFSRQPVAVARRPPTSSPAHFNLNPCLASQSHIITLQL